MAALLIAFKEGFSHVTATLLAVDERVLTERLVTYDTSTAEGLHAAAGFVKGWLEARDIDVEAHRFGELHALTASVGPEGVPTIVFHGHLDIVPGLPEQFAPRIEGDRLYGRGAYDMKGGLAAMMCAVHDLAGQTGVRIRLVIVPDEESEDIERRSSDDLVRRGYVGDFAITGEPTDLHIGVQAKGVLAARIQIHGRAAHGSTPWLGDNAIVKAVDVFRRIESMPFSRESSEMFDRPSINLGRIVGGDAPNKVPDACVMDVDIRYLPNQDPGDILEQIRMIPDIDIKRTFVFPPAHVSPSNPFVRALCAVVAPATDGASVSVGRDGASDAVSFLRAGVPAVEFGPAGEGHHGPEEWVSIRSLARYRQLLVDFAHAVPARLADGATAPLRAVEGGAA
jgi:succinyl-diaminopimelate desuccinylase